MTEAEWLGCMEAKAMLDFVQSKASDRKLRLFAVACCRHSLQCMIEADSRKAVEVAELYADGLATEEELRVAHLGVNTIWGESRAFAAWASDKPVQAETICTVQRPTWVNHSILLRDIFGNPFRPVCVDASWRTPDVTSLAGAIYAERAFDGLPVLADALEEVGCMNVEILSHCRQRGEHVRGCWVIDELIGK